MSSLFGGARAKIAEQRPSPVIAADTTPAQDTSPDALRRAGRASILLSTSSQGILGQPKTGRQQLLSA